MLEESSQDKILKYLILGVIIASIFILLNSGVFRSKPFSFSLPQRPFKEIKIDYKVLENQEIEKLLPFEKISFPEEAGRENPFSPYGE